MKRILIVLMLCGGGVAIAQNPQTTANRVIQGAGAPTAGLCAVIGDVGKVYARNDGAAANTTFYVCANTAASTYGWELEGGGGGGGGVSTVSVVTANGVSGSVATPTTTPAITLTLGAITPTSVAVGSSPPVLTGNGIVGLGETTGQACAANADCIIADSATHRALLSNNNATAVPIVVGPASATSGHWAAFNGTSGGIISDGGAIPTGTVTSIATTSPIGGGTITGTGTITCTTCVVASSPGAGVAHFAGGTQTATSSAVSLTADVSGVLPAANIGVVASVFNTGTITIPSGNSVLVGCTSTCSVPVPVPAAGYQICVKNDAGVSTVITLSALGSSAMYPKADDSGYGTAGTGTMVSTAATGNKVCLIGRDATHYELGAVNAPANWTVN